MTQFENGVFGSIELEPSHFERSGTMGRVAHTLAILAPLALFGCSGAADTSEEEDKSALVEGDEALASELTSLLSGNGLDRVVEI